MFLDVNNFDPLNSDVWGSFLDVAILIMTTIGTVYLILNFKSQSVINKKQAALNDLLVEKERRNQNVTDEITF